MYEAWRHVSKSSSLLATKFLATPAGKVTQNLNLLLQTFLAPLEALCTSMEDEHKLTIQRSKRHVPIPVILLVEQTLKLVLRIVLLF